MKGGYSIRRIKIGWGELLIQSGNINGWKGTECEQSGLLCVVKKDRREGVRDHHAANARRQAKKTVLLFEATRRSRGKYELPECH